MGPCERSGSHTGSSEYRTALNSIPIMALHVLEPKLLLLLRQGSPATIEIV